MRVLDVFRAAVFEVVEDDVHADAGEAGSRPAEAVREVDRHCVGVDVCSCVANIVQGRLLGCAWNIRKLWSRTTTTRRMDHFLFWRGGWAKAQRRFRGH